MTFTNAAFTKRGYEASNLVAFVAPSVEAVNAAFPAAKPVAAADAALAGLDRLWTQGGVTAYGYL